MSTATATQVIGSHCDHRGCTAPVRVSVRFVAGDLAFCMHHWVGMEEAVIAAPSFVSAAPAEDAPPD